MCGVCVCNYRQLMITILYDIIRQIIIVTCIYTFKKKKKGSTLDFIIYN